MWILDLCERMIDFSEQRPGKFHFIVGVLAVTFMALNFALERTDYVFVADFIGYYVFIPWIVIYGVFRLKRHFFGRPKRLDR